MAAGNDDARTELDAAPARDDLLRRLEGEYDLELAELAMARVCGRVEPHTWEAFRLTALEELSGAEAAARLRRTAAWMYAARAKVQRMVRDALAALDADAADS